MCFAAAPLCETFAQSFVGPLVIGVICGAVFWRTRWGKVLAGICILIGVIIGVINMQLIDKYWIWYEGYESRLMFIAMMMDFVFVPVMAIGVIQTMRAHDSGKPWKPSAKLVAAFLVVILVITIVGANVIHVTKIPHKYSYTVRTETQSTDPYYMYVPTPVEYSGEISPFIDKVQVKSGNVNITRVNTQYGWALNLSATGPFEIGVSGEGDESAYDHLSLETNKTSWRGDRAIYYSSISTIPLKYRIESSNHYVSYSGGCVLNNTVNATGWQKTNGYCATAVV